MDNPYTPKENPQLGSHTTQPKSRGLLGVDYAQGKDPGSEGGQADGFGTGSSGSHTGVGAGFGGAKAPSGTKNAG